VSKSFTPRCRGKSDTAVPASVSCSSLGPPSLETVCQCSQLSRSLLRCARTGAGARECVISLSGAASRFGITEIHKAVGRSNASFAILLTGATDLQQFLAQPLARYEHDDDYYYD